MECINHPGTMAAGTCQLCGKALCGTCINRFMPPACEPCLNVHNTRVAQKLFFDLGITVSVFLGVMTVMLTRTPGNWQAAIIIGLILPCAYWGWQFLGRFSVPVVFTNGTGLVAYLFAKFFLVTCFGFIVAPWQIYRRVKELAAINKLKKQIAQGKI